MKARRTPAQRERQREVALAHWDSVRAARAAVAQAEARLQAQHAAVKTKLVLQMVKARRIVDLAEVRRLLHELEAA